MSAIHSSGTITDGSSTAVLRADNHADRFGGSLSRRAQTNRIGHVNADQETVERQPDIMDVRSRFQHRHRNRRSAVDDRFADIVPAARTSRRAGDPLVVHCDGARVWIGSMKIDCQWQPVSQSLMKIPAARDWIAALALRYFLPPGRIATEGLTKEVENTERKLARLVARVAGAARRDGRRYKRARRKAITGTKRRTIAAGRACRGISGGRLIAL
jgi:hypothetical protein